VSILDFTGKSRPADQRPLPLPACARQQRQTGRRVRYRPTRRWWPDVCLRPR